MLVTNLVLFILVFSGSISCYKKDGKCYKPMNLLIALDVSGSIQPDSWQSEIDLSKEIVRSFAIQSSGNKFAIMDFSTEPNIAYSLDINAEKAIKALNELKSNFKDGHSFIDLALHEASKMLSSAKSADHLRTLLIITDGYMTLKNGKEDTYYLTPAKDKLVAAKVEVFAVGVGESVNENALKLIASDASHVFKIRDGKTLLERIQKSAETPCPAENDGFQGRADSEALKCGKVLFERIGCYRDKQRAPRPLPHLIFTDRDTTSHVYSGQTINWKKWNAYLPGLVCRCAEESSKKEKVIFGLQYYGECWANAMAAAADTFNKDGPAESDSKCKTLDYKPCVAASEYCVGESEHNFVYRIVGKAEK